MKYLALVLGLLLGGCTALTRFDDEGQPCELAAPAGQQCLAGYECQTSSDGGVCRKADAGTP